MLSGCVVVPAERPPIQLSATFDAGQAEKLLAPGSNAVQGSAFMRQRGGGVVTCAGSPVYLLPATAYAQERIAALYGSADGGVSTWDFTFNPDPPAYRTLTRATTCDAQGHFQFGQVADGDFYVQTKVVWEIGHTTQGGNMIKKVSLKNGTNATVVISG